MKIDKKRDEQEKPVRVSFFHFFLFVLCVGVGLCMTVLYTKIYKAHEHSSLTQTIVNILPVPAGTVNGSVFWYKDIFAFYTLAQIEGTSEDSFARAVEAVIRYKTIDLLARDFALSVEVRAPQEDVWSQYGWTKEQYTRYVLTPLALAEALDTKIQNASEYQADVLAEAQRILGLAQNGVAFDDLAIQFSQSASAPFGGELGVVCIETLEVPKVGTWPVQHGEQSDIIELSDRFVIALAQSDNQNASEQEEEPFCTRVDMYVIVLYKQGFADALDRFYKDADIVFFGNSHP